MSARAFFRTADRTAIRATVHATGPTPAAAPLIRPAAPEWPA